MAEPDPGAFFGDAPHTFDARLVTVDPDRNGPQRWPLFPLADWSNGWVPVCVVEADGSVWIDAPTEPVKVIEPVAEGMIG